MKTQQDTFDVKGQVVDNGRYSVAERCGVLASRLS